MEKQSHSKTLHNRELECIHFHRHHHHPQQQHHRHDCRASSARMAADGLRIFLRRCRRRRRRQRSEDFLVQSGGKMIEIGECERCARCFVFVFVHIRVFVHALVAPRGCQPAHSISMFDSGSDSAQMFVFSSTRLDSTPANGWIPLELVRFTLRDPATTLLKISRACSLLYINMTYYLSLSSASASTACLALDAQRRILYEIGAHLFMMQTNNIAYD